MMKQQEIIVKELHAIRPKKSELLKELAELLCTSERTVYSRMNGTHDFSLDEIRRVINHFGLDANQLFIDVPSTDRINRVNAKKFVENLFNHWMIQVEHIQKQASPLIFMTSNTLSFSLAMQFPNLVKYRIYVLLKYYKSFPELQERPFRLEDNLYEAVEKQCAWLHAAYKSLPSTEVWSESTFHITIQKMANLYAQKLMPKEVFLILLNELHEMIILCETYSKKGYKTTENAQLNINRPTYHVYLNKSLNVNEYTILSWHQNGVEQFYVFHPVDGVANTLWQKQSIINYCNNLQAESISLNSPNGLARRSFFRKAKNAVHRQQKALA